MKKRMKRWASALLALMLLVSLSAPAALAQDSSNLVYREATGNVFLRTGAGKQFSEITIIPKGDVVVVTNMWYKAWYKVKYTNSDGKTYEGYVSSAYLKETSKRKNEKKKEKPVNLRALGCYSTTAAIPLRKGPGTNYHAIVTVHKGYVVNVTDTKSADWSKCIYYNTKGTKYTGYLSAKYLTKAAEPYNTKTKTYLYRSASTKSKSLAELGKGAYIFVTDTYSKSWFKVRYTDIHGNTHHGYVQRSKVKKGKITNKPYKQVDPEAEAKKIAEEWRTKTRYALTEKTKLTKTASSKGTKVATLSKGAVVAVTGSSGKYYKVIWNDSSNKKKVGYLPKSKLKKYTDPNGGDYVTTVQTQLRKTDSESGSVLVTIRANALFTVKDTSEKSWYWASYTTEGTTYTGFVYKAHAKKYEEKNAGTYYTTVKTPMRKSDSDTGSVVLDLPQGAVVKVTKTYNPSWYYASYTDGNDETWKGYISSAHLGQFKSMNLNYVATVPTVLRWLPSQTGEPVADVLEAQAVTVNDTLSGKWYWATVTDASGKKVSGYIDAAYVMQKEEYEAQKAAEQKPVEQEEDISTQSAEDASTDEEQTEDVSADETTEEKDVEVQESSDETDETDDEALDLAA